MITWWRWWRTERRTRRANLGDWAIIAGPGIAAAWLARRSRDR